MCREIAIKLVDCCFEAGCQVEAVGMLCQKLPRQRHSGPVCSLTDTCQSDAIIPSLFPNLLKNTAIELNSCSATKINSSKQLRGPWWLKTFAMPIWEHPRADPNRVTLKYTLLLFIFEQEEKPVRRKWVLPKTGCNFCSTLIAAVWWTLPSVCQSGAFGGTAESLLTTEHAKQITWYIWIQIEKYRQDKYPRYERDGLQSCTWRFLWLHQVEPWMAPSQNTSCGNKTGLELQKACMWVPTAQLKTQLRTSKQVEGLLWETGSSKQSLRTLPALHTVLKNAHNSARFCFRGQRCSRNLEGLSARGRTATLITLESRQHSERKGPG